MTTFYLNLAATRSEVMLLIYTFVSSKVIKILQEKPLQEKIEQAVETFYSVGKRSYSQIKNL